MVSQKVSRISKTYLIVLKTRKPELERLRKPAPLLNFKKLKPEAGAGARGGARGGARAGARLCF